MEIHWDEVFCIEDFFYLPKYKGYDRKYYKYKTYQIQYINSRNERFVFTDIKNSEGNWFTMDNFNKHFTFDKNFIRKHKLERLTNE